MLRRITSAGMKKILNGVIRISLTKKALKPSLRVSQWDIWERAFRAQGTAYGRILRQTFRKGREPRSKKLYWQNVDNVSIY